MTYLVKQSLVRRGLSIVRRTLLASSVDARFMRERKEAGERINPDDLPWHWRGENPALGLDPVLMMEQSNSARLNIKGTVP